MSAPLFEPTGHVVRVALPVPVDELFEYTIPPESAARIRPGCRIRVRFGGRSLIGVAVELSEKARFGGRLRSIDALIDDEPALSETLIGVLRQVASDVLCPIGVALAAALPPGSSPVVSRGFQIAPRGLAALESGAMHGAARKALEVLRAGPLSQPALRRRAGADAFATLEPLRRDRLVIPCEIESGPRARVARERVAQLPPGIDLAAARAALSRAPAQQSVFEELLDGAPHRARELASAPLRALARRGFVRVFERAAPRDVLGEALESPRSVELTADQADACKQILDAIRARSATSYLLHGVTGSGKTEVYLRAVAAALDAGRQALVLVPEITLTHQILARLRGRFGDQLAVLHSGLSQGERLEQWQRLRAGRTPIAVGARSALFAPLENLGVIAIDEEHDGAYKNDEGFRYHARELALARARAAGCPVVMGSATPALETRHAADRGELVRLVLPHRIGGRPLPSVELVDLSVERASAPRGRKQILSRRLREALRSTLESGGQTILFLNRRGFSTRIFCFDCGQAERCVDCDVALVFHTSDGLLHCHYCEHRRPPPERCAGCGAPDTALLGVGTERLEEEVRSIYPDARLARLDRDTASKRGATENILRALREERVDVLIGTQMVAKGHDFPGVRLVGVIAADLGLHMPDFRAAERCFQLLTQVAGRAGRDRAPGRVIVQTFSPDHYAMRPVLNHDYESFYAEELGHRASLGFPPFGCLASVLVSAEALPDAMEAANALARVAAEASPACERLGPAPAPLPRLRARHRQQLLLKGEEAPVREAARAVLAASAKLREGVTAAVDLRPWNML